MARRKLYGQFHQPSHILRYYPIEMECFVYNWRILLTGTLSGVTGGLQNGGSITTPLSGVNGG